MVTLWHPGLNRKMTDDQVKAKEEELKKKTKKTKVTVGQSRIKSC